MREHFQRPGHGGACGQACQNAQSCHQGRCTYDVVAACFTSGEITGIQEGSSHKGPNVAVGAGPASLAALEDVLLVADGINQTLYQVRLAAPPDAGADVLAPFPQTAAIGAGTNHVLVEGDLVYVANAFGQTLQILKRTPAGVPDGGANPNGVTLTTVGEVNFGANTTPEAVAKIGTFAYVPLYGSFGSASAAGQKVVKVDVSNPLLPAVSKTFDLSALDLQPFSHDAGSSVARPSSIAALGGILYVTLNNLNAADYSVQGPGLLARIDPATDAVTTVSLGASCLNPVWVTTDGEALYVSCAGRTDFATTAEKTGVVALRNDLLVGSSELGCADAGSFDPGTGAGCRLPIAGRIAVRNKQIYVADQNGGRVFGAFPRRQPAGGAEGLRRKRGRPGAGLRLRRRRNVLQRRRPHLGALTDGPLPSCPRAAAGLRRRVGGRGHSLPRSPAGRTGRQGGDPGPLAHRDGARVCSPGGAGGGLALRRGARGGPSAAGGRLHRPQRRGGGGAAPDLVLVQPSPGNRKAVETLAGLGIRVLCLPMQNLEQTLAAMLEGVAHSTNWPPRPRRWRASTPSGPRSGRGRRGSPRSGCSSRTASRRWWWPARLVRRRAARRRRGGERRRRGPGPLPGVLGRERPARADRRGDRRQRCAGGKRAAALAAGLETGPLGEAPLEGPDAPRPASGAGPARAVRAAAPGLVSAPFPLTRSFAMAERFSPARLLRVTLLLGALALGRWCSRCVSEQPLSLAAALTGQGSDGVIFWSLRWPRALLAAIVGAALALFPGCTLQGLMRNPLADPFVLGVSGGAALGTTFAVAFGLGPREWPEGVGGYLGPSLFALVGALLATGLVFALGRAAGQGAPHATLLSGVVFNAFALGVITFVKTLAAPEKMGESSTGWPGVGVRGALDAFHRRPAGGAGDRRDVGGGGAVEPLAAGRR